MKENEKITVWVTRYALTEGIRSYTGYVSDIGNGSMFCVDRTDSSLSQTFHGEGKDWHRTYEGAKQRAEDMRTRKIASLKRTINALEKLAF